MSYTQGTLDQLRLDPRLEVGAYVTDGNNLYEVVRRTKRQVVLENCINDACKGKVLERALEDYQLVKRSPRTPDFVDASIGAAA